MAITPPRFNPNQPIPNNPFYSPTTNAITAVPGSLIVGPGLTVDQATGTITASGGGGGGISSLTAGAGITLTPSPITATGSIALTPVGTAGTVLFPASLTVNAYGQITAKTAGSAPITGVTASAPLSASGTTTRNISLAVSGVTAGSYTLANVTVDTFGRVTTAANGAAVTSVATGTGLTGGPITATGTISLANTAVSPGSYTYGSFTVDAQGRLTAAGNGTAPVTAVTATAPLASSGGLTPVLSLNASGVVAGSYTYASFTVDSFGRVTVASSGTAPNTTVTAPITNTGTAVAPIIGIQNATTGQLGAVKIGTNIDVAAGVISVASASTTVAGIVQLNDTVSSTSDTEALTAAQGKLLQDQINSLTAGGGLTLAGTFDATASQMLTVTSSGSGVGFVIGNDLPAAAVGNTDYFVIVTTGGSYTPPGAGGPILTLGTLVGGTGYTPGTYLGEPLVGGTGNGATADITVDGAGVITNVVLQSAGTGYNIGDSLTALSTAGTPWSIDVATVGPSTPFVTSQGDWLLSSGTTWEFLNVGTDLPIASTGTAGIVELATSAETSTGTSTTLAVTPAGAAATYLAKSALPSKGALVSATAASTPSALTVGTDGQVLVACAAATSGLCWLTQAADIPCAAVTAKGDLLTGTAAAAVTALTVGTNGQVLVADSTCSTGLKWSTPSADVPCAAFTAKGDVLGGTAAGTYAALPIGADNQILVACAATTTGLCWVANPAGADIPCAAFTAKGDILGGASAGAILTLGTLVGGSGYTPGTYLAEPLVGGSGSGATADITVDGAGVITAVLLTSPGLGYTVADSLTAFTPTGTPWSIPVATIGGAYAALPVGTNGQVLVADSTCATGLKWSAGGGGVTSVATGTGLTGGPITTTGTIALADTAVTAGSYTYAAITVDAQGRLTAAADGDEPVLAAAYNATGTILTGGAVGSILTFGTLDGGSGYSPGTYLDEPLVGGAGTGATANITVDGSGVITAAVLSSGGAGYNIGDSLTAFTPTGTPWSIDVATVGTYAALAVGADGTLLVADSTCTNGVKWEALTGTPGTPLVAGVLFGCTTSGNTSTAYGYNSGILGVNNTAVGFGAANGACGNDNTYLGYNAGGPASVGCTPVANTIVGSNALTQLTDGQTNIAIGWCSGKPITTQSENIAIGNCSLWAINLGYASSCNVAVGHCALCGSSEVTASVGVGNKALGGNGCGDYNVAVGNDALLYAPQGSDGACSVAVGYRALFGAKTGNNNVAVGYIAGLGLECGFNNVAVGACAMCNSAPGVSAANNVAVGYGTLRAIDNGSLNVAVGAGAGAGLSTGDQNVAVGADALSKVGNTANRNTAVGYQTLPQVTLGSGNVAVGADSGSSLTVGENNTFVGYGAAKGITTGANNVAIGNDTFCAASATGDNNTAVGVLALAEATLGSGNVAVGRGAASCLTTACNTVALGTLALSDMTTAPGNVAVGYAAAQNIVTGANNVAVGTCTLGASAVVATNITDSVAVGSCALTKVTTGNCNVAVGALALCSVTSGRNNTAVGSRALSVLTTGCENVAIGIGTSDSITTGGCNTAVGSYALTAANSGSNNTALGWCAGGSTTSGFSNVYVGMNAGSGNTIGGCNVMIGRFAGCTGGSDSNVFIGFCAGFNANSNHDCSILIGSNAGNGSFSCGCQVVVGHNSCSTNALGANVIIGNGIVGNFGNVGSVVIGRGGCTCATFAIQTASSWAFTSDARVKDGVTALPVSGEDFINALRPVSYCFLDRQTKQPLEQKHCNVGFIAQEVEKALEDNGLSHISNLITKPEDENEYYQLAETAMVPFLVKAVQELSAKVEALEAKLAE